VAGAGNLISGHSNSGIFIEGATNNVVHGNLIGTNAAGSGAIPNGVGIAFNTGSSNTIGGTSAPMRNVISGNSGSGISLGNNSINNLIQGNFIGTDIGGSGSLGNGFAGIQVGSSSNSIGGTVAGAGNVIAFNSANGVDVTGSTTSGVQILGNTIHSNAELGINLGPPGVLPNDLGDSDTGPNNLQNFPVLTSATNSAGITTVLGSLNSTPSTTFRIELFRNSVCDASGHGEGLEFIGFTVLGTDNSGNLSINLPGFSVAIGQFITATATNVTTNDTSEFSACVQVTAANQGPVVTAPANQTVDEGTLLSFTVTAADADGPGPLTLVAGDLPLGATFDTGTGQFNWTPGAGQAGTYPVSFTATDGVGLVGTATTIVTVNNTVVDSDADGVPDANDNCPLVANADQADADGDGVGNACDNSPLNANPGQQDADGDGVGDASEGQVDTVAVASPPTFAGGYLPQEPIDVTANVTFTANAIATSCLDESNQPGYLAKRPRPSDILLFLRNQLGEEIFAEQIPEGPGSTLADPAVPGSDLVCISSTRTLSTQVRLNDSFPNLGTGSYSLKLMYSAHEKDPRTDPVTGNCLPGEAECFVPAAIWQGDAPAGTVAIPILATTGADDAPTAAAQSVTTPEDTPLVITLSASDVDSPSLTFAIATPPTKGSLGALSAPNCVPVGSGANCSATVTYTPTLHENGSDSFMFTASNALTSAPATVSITITPVNDPPFFNAIANQTATQGTGPQQVVITGIVAGPTNEAAQTVALTALSDNPAVVPHPTISPVVGGNATLTYQPVSAGSVTITVSANDGQSVNNTFARTFTITVNATATNNAPTITPIANQAVNEGQAVSFTVTATDADGPGPLTLGVEGLPLGATFTSSTGQFAWTPSAAQAGSYLLTFTATDGAGSIGTAETTITVNNTVVDTDADGVPDAVDNCPLVANTDQADADGDGVGNACDNSPLNANPGQQDADGDGVGDASDGQVDTVATVNPPTFSGGFLQQEPIIVQAQVTATANAIPNSCTDAGGQPGYLFVRPDSLLNVQVFNELGQEIFAEQIPEGSGLTIADPTVPGSSLVCISAEQTFTAQVNVSEYFPNLPPGTYKIKTSYTSHTSDPRTDPVTGNCLPGEAECFGPNAIWQGTAPAGTITVAVLPETPAANDPPAAAFQSKTLLEDAPATTIILAASDVDSPSLTISLASSPTKGTLGPLSATTCTPVGSGTNCTATVAYTPAANANGPDSFTFRASDGALFSPPATVAIAVTPVNDAPSFLKGQNQTVAAGAGPQTVANWATSISAGPANESSQTVTFLVTPDLPALFTAAPAISPTGTLTYTPGATAGTATVTVRIKDNGGTLNGGVDTSAPQSFTITISGGVVAMQRVNVSSAGVQANGGSLGLGEAVSGDGRYVTFISGATNLVGQDSNGNADVFLRDRQSGTTTRLSVSTAGAQANAGSVAVGISSTGRYVVFVSGATNLVNSDTNGQADVFVRDTCAGAATGCTPSTTRVSVTNSGAQANGRSLTAAISGNGRYVAFSSAATNLVSGDNNNRTDIFVRDTCAGVTSGCTPSTTRVSRSSSGTQANNDSILPALSSDGRYVAFTSAATNLVSGDNNNRNDIFVHDRQTNSTTRVSRSTGGTQSNNDSTFPAISGDGRYVAFSSTATNLVSGDTNGVSDVFVHDRQTGATTRVSVATGGAAGNSNSLNPSVSDDGRFVVFGSAATNLVTGDTNNKRDIFVHDRQTGTTRRVSAGAAQANNDSVSPAISGDGRVISFSSTATNLVTGDSNTVADVFVVGNPLP
jgi:hypothetical protein